MNRFDKLYNKIIAESSITKIMSYVENFECAAISASRRKITNTTEKTYIPTGYKDELELTKDENRLRNNELKAALLKLGYGVTALDGRYAENGYTFPGKETSYFVVNRDDDPNFFDNIFNLAEYYNQDSFLYKPKGGIKAQLVGTNATERNEAEYQPGFNQSIEVGDFHPNGFDGALSKVGGRAFQFRLNENKFQNPKFFADKILCEEIFENLPIQSKAAVTRVVRKMKCDLK